MTINNAELYVAGMWDWAILKGCFVMTNIMPTDLDGFVEINGKFLILETKAPGVNVPFGQLLAFKRLTEKENACVLIVWGETNKPEHYQIIKKGEAFKKKPGDLEKVRGIVSSWFENAAGSRLTYH